jgi:hypothetical protein
MLHYYFYKNIYKSIFGLGKIKKMKKVDFKTIMLSEDWIISDLTYDKDFKKYNFKATHISGEVLEISKSKKHVDKILKQIENE